MTQIVAARKVAAKNGTSWTSTAAVCRAPGMNCQREMFGELVREVLRVQIEGFGLGTVSAGGAIVDLWRMRSRDLAERLMIIVAYGVFARGNWRRVTRLRFSCQ
jgi:hypothetical protein